MWEPWGDGSGRLDSMVEGQPEAANIFPPAFSSWGDLARSRASPHLQAAQVGTAAESFFSTGSSLPALLGFLMTLGPFPQLQNGRQVFFPLYMWSTESGCCLYLETLLSLSSLFFIDRSSSRAHRQQWASTRRHGSERVFGWFQTTIKLTLNLQVFPAEAPDITEQK